MSAQIYNFTKKHIDKIKLNIWDVVSIFAIFIILISLAKVATGMSSPYKIGQQLSISLDLNSLTYYSMRSVLRMAIAIMISLIFSLIIGYASAKNKKAESICIPLIDVLQSVPILGFLSITVVGFIWLFPNSLLGPECAAIFAIFTSQAWNMTLSIYQSIKLLPSDYNDVGHALHLNAWQRFWRIELPYATPGLLWNMMISLSGGWFFVVASEAISVNNTEILLPGIGSYIQTAINQSNLTAITYALLAMLCVIFIYDQLIFRPLLKISNQFQDDNQPDEDSYDKKENIQQYNSWVYDILQKTNLVKKSLVVKDYLFDLWINKLSRSYIRQRNNLLDFKYYQYIKKSLYIQGKNIEANNSDNIKKSTKFILLSDYYKNIKHLIITTFSRVGITLDLFTILVASFLGSSTYVLYNFIQEHISFSEVTWVVMLGFITGVKIFILVFIVSLIWLPIGVYIGMRPKLSKYLQPIIQFLAAFPANLIYPLLVYLILRYSLNIEIATAPLLIIGTQWYILFNIIAGMNTIPKDLDDVIKSYNVKGSLWWRKYLLPAIFPYYITGAMTAAGGAWNASIVAESLSWGTTKLQATGIGAYIVNATHDGDFARIALGITIMSIYVTVLNKLLWQKLYDLAANRYSLE